LTNISSLPLPILVKTTDFTAGDFSGEMEFDESLQDPIIASRKWFEIQSPNFILDTKEKTEINFEIKVPENAEPGGHYSAMLFEPQLPSYYFKFGQPKTIPVIGVLFLLSVNDFSLEPKNNTGNPLLEIAEFKIPQEEKMHGAGNFLANILAFVSASEINIVDNAPSKFLAQIKNNDIYHHKVSGKLLIYNTLGKKVGESDIKRITILPGKIREFPINITPETPNYLKFLPASISSFIAQNTSLGKYKVILDLTGENNNLELNQAITFWAFPWKTIIVIIIITLGFILVRKRVIAGSGQVFRVALD